jgi:ribA/ribD-fused uncharacterized protein
MIDAITSFSGEYRFLSNFWPAKVSYMDLDFPTVEHAFVAAKSDDPAFWRTVQQIPTPGSAKKLGRSVKLRDNWEQARVIVMHGLLQQKFHDNPLRTKLLETRHVWLEEGNTWGDTFWGVCNGVGENMLGKLLMLVREEVR